LEKKALERVDTGSQPPGPERRDPIANLHTNVYRFYIENYIEGYTAINSKAPRSVYMAVPAINEQRIII